LARNDRLITLSWNVTVTKAGTDGTWLAGTKMSASLAGLSVSDYDVSGVTLVDPVNSKRYLVARSGGSREGQGRCVRSTVSSALQAGNAMSLYATFTAPSPDVTKVNVDLVALGVFHDVPIS
jgi:hypothetical protein